MPPEKKIPGKHILEWKQYTYKYFSQSPNAFLAENQFYKDLPANLKRKVVKDNLMLDFQKRFDILFRDPEFNFKADKYLITQIVASLTYEHVRDNDVIMRLNEVSSSIFFVHEGEVEVSYKYNRQPLLLFEQGSYFGDTSFIFKILNQYAYRVKPCEHDARIFSLHAKYLDAIFEDNQQFASVLKIRALRRHRYLRKLKNQQAKLFELRQMQQEAPTRGSEDDDSLDEQIIEYVKSIKKVRLVEDQMSYEDMAVLRNFSDDEITFALNRQLLKEKYDRIALQRVRRVQNKLRDLKNVTREGLHAYCDAIYNIEDQGKKLVFQHFNAAEANHLEREIQRTQSQFADLSEFFGDQQQEPNKKTPGNDYTHLIDSDDFESDSSGNHSSNDEINKIVKFQESPFANMEYKYWKNSKKVTSFDPTLLDQDYVNYVSDESPEKRDLVQDLDPGAKRQNSPSDYDAHGNLRIKSIAISGSGSN